MKRPRFSRLGRSPRWQAKFVPSPTMRSPSSPAARAAMAGNSAGGAPSRRSPRSGHQHDMRFAPGGAGGMASAARVSGAVAKIVLQRRTASAPRRASVGAGAAPARRFPPRAFAGYWRDVHRPERADRHRASPGPPRMPGQPLGDASHGHPRAPQSRRRARVFSVRIAVSISIRGRARGAAARGAVMAG